MDVVMNNNQDEFDNWSVYSLMTNETVQNNSILLKAIQHTMRRTISADDLRDDRSYTINELLLEQLINQIFRTIFERKTTTTTVFCHDDVINAIGIVFRFFENFPRPNDWGRDHPQVLFVQTLWFQPSTVYSGTEFRSLMTNTELNLSSIVLYNLKNLGLLPQEKIQEYHNKLDWREWSSRRESKVIRIAENILNGDNYTYNRPNKIFTEAMSIQFQKNENTEQIKILLESVPGTSIELLKQFGKSLKSIQFLQMLFQVGIKHSFVQTILSFFSRLVRKYSDYSKSSYELCCERFDKVTINGLVTQIFNRTTTEALRRQENCTIMTYGGRTFIAPYTLTTEFYYCPDMIDFVLKNNPLLIISTTTVANLSTRSLTDWSLYYDEEKLEVRLQGSLSLTRARKKNKLRGPIFVSSKSSIQLSIADLMAVRNGNVHTVIPENNPSQPLRLLKRKRVVERDDHMYSRPRFCDVRGEGMLCDECFPRAINIMKHKVDARLNDADISSERKEIVRLRNHYHKQEADSIRFLNENVDIENEITIDDHRLDNSDRDSELELRHMLLINYQKHLEDYILFLKNMHDIENKL